MSLVKDLMTHEPATIGADATMADAAKTMVERDVELLPVVYAGRLVAVVSDGDLVTRGVAEGRTPSDPVLDVATQEPVTAAPGDEVPVVLARMAAARVRRLPVMEDGVVVGILDREAATGRLSGQRGGAPEDAVSRAAR
jgi:CBS domain-containing protein